jgi:hypothetical protein
VSGYLKILFQLRMLRIIECDMKMMINDEQLRTCMHYSRNIPADRDDNGDVAQRE